MTFTGFDPDAPAFYAELEQHNTKEWWLANKQRYDEAVRAPADALIEQLGAEFGPVKIFRPYRDVRFSADKRPYKDHLGLVTTPADGTALYLQLSQTGLMLAGGYYRPATDQLKRFRAIVDDNRLVGDLEATIEEVGESGFEVFDEDALTTAPRGFTVDHPKIDLLRLRNLAIRRVHAVEPWMFGPESLDRVREGWRTIGIWNDWLVENVGPTVSPAQRR